LKGEKLPNGIVVGTPSRLPVIVTFPNGDQIQADVKEGRPVGFHQILPVRKDTPRGIFRWLRKEKPKVISLHGIVDTAGIATDPDKFIAFAQAVKKVMKMTSVTYKASPGEE
jgi:hypothetical protein